MIIRLADITKKPAITLIHIDEVLKDKPPIDLDAVIGGGGVLCQNGDAALPLQVAGIHHAVLHHLVIAEGAALLEHLIDQRGLAVVYMGNNGYVS